MLKRRALWLIAAVTAALAVGCTDQTSFTSPPDNAINAAVAKLRFHTEGMIDRGDYVVVEGDIALRKSDILALSTQHRDTVRRKGPTGLNYQWVTDTLISPSRVQTIVVDLSGISGDADWTNAVRGAMGNWNSIPGTFIWFSEGTPGNVTVSFANLGDPRNIALTDFPTGSPGGPGPTMRINSQSDVWQTYAASQKLLVATHELGHALGFRHTNWQGYQCGINFIQESGGAPSGPGANQVVNTPATDGGSIMNGCTGGNYWFGFSHYDSLAAMYTYGFLSLGESNDGGHPLVTYSFSERGMVSASFHLHYETWGYDENWSWQLMNSYDVGVPLGSPYRDGTDPWAYTSCFYMPSPNYEDDVYWQVDIVYPQATRSMRIPAHVIDESGNPNMTCN